MKIPTLNEIKSNITRMQASLDVFEREYLGVLAVLKTIPADCITLCYFYPGESSHNLIIYVTTREAFAPLRALHPRWEKSYDVYGEKAVVTYRAEGEGKLSIVCEVGELPPSCTIVETIVNLPATPALPARTVMKRKIKCLELKTAEQASAAARENSEGSPAK